MIKFNLDGSLKIPSNIAKIIENDKQKLRNQLCIKVKRDLVISTTPKKCILHITLSEAILDQTFIDTIYNYFKENAQMTTKIIRINNKEIDIGTNFRKCTECNSLISRYREFLYGNIIGEKEGCTFEIRKRNFAYEDYF